MDLDPKSENYPPAAEITTEHMSAMAYALVSAGCPMAARFLLAAAQRIQVLEADIRTIVGSRPDAGEDALRRAEALLDAGFGIGREAARQIISTEVGAERIYDVAAHVLAAELERGGATADGESADYWRGRFAGMVEALRLTHSPEQLAAMGLV